MSKRVDRIIEAATLLYGKNWQSPLARIADVSQPHLANIIAGVRELTSEVETTIAETLVAEAKRLRKSADKIERIAEAMKSEK